MPARRRRSGPRSSAQVAAQKKAAAASAAKRKKGKAASKQTALGGKIWAKREMGQKLTAKEKKIASRAHKHDVFQTHVGEAMRQDKHWDGWLGSPRKTYGDLTGKKVEKEIKRRTGSRPRFKNGTLRIKGEVGSRLRSSL